MPRPTLATLEWHGDSEMYCQLAAVLEAFRAKHKPINDFVN